MGRAGSLWFPAIYIPAQIPAHRGETMRLFLHQTIPDGILLEEFVCSWVYRKKLKERELKEPEF